MPWVQRPNAGVDPRRLTCGFHHAIKNRLVWPTFIAREIMLEELLLITTPLPIYDRPTLGASLASRPLIPDYNTATKYQTANMNFRQISTTLSSFRSLFVMWDREREESTDGIQDAIVLGLMTGSAVVSPVLVDAPAVWRHLEILIFITSCGWFTFNHRVNIKIYGPIVLPIAALLGLGAYASSRTPLRDLISWIPVILSILLLLTVYSLPLLCSEFGSYSPISQQISLEDGLSELSGRSNEAMPDSIQASESSGSEHRSSPGSPFCEQCHREHQISHMSRSTSPPVSSVRGSEIDLDDTTLDPFISLVSHRPTDPPWSMPKEPCQPSLSAGSPVIPIRLCRTCLINNETSFRNADRAARLDLRAAHYGSGSPISHVAQIEPDVSGNFNTP